MVKWQTGSVIGIVSLFFIMGVLLNLAGVSHSDSGDVACTDCFSEIKINSTYWEVRGTFERPDENVVFKKRTRSRTLWVNLLKINELVTTDPSIKVDILVPTNRIALTEIKHPEYGRLRFLKEGDTLIRRSTINRPGPSRIILHGTKSATQTVKWNFDLEHFLMEDINIDPVWLPTRDSDLIQECEIQTHSVRRFNVKEVTKTRLCPILNGSCSTSYKINVTTSYYDYINESVNCWVSYFQKDGLKVSCPEDHRCYVIGNEFCAMDCNDGDCSKTPKDNIGWGWSYTCFDIDNLPEGNHKVASYNKEVLRIERT